MGLKYTIEDMNIVARKHGGKCLSKKYVDTDTKLEWQCAKGHRWKRIPYSVKNKGTWCPVCKANKKRSTRERIKINEFNALAKSLGGKCLSKKYVNLKTKLEWECKKGHRWKATPDSIKYRGSWCLECSGNKRLTIKKMQEIAKSRGGKCLSKKYVNAHTNLKWECAHGHTWMLRWNKVQQGQWCPECSDGITERICRAFFQQLFNKPFPKSRPRWLKNSRGNQMELDGYCKDLRIAFEHQGEQHYSTKTQYIKSKEKLQKRKNDDKKKMQLCKKYRVRLFCIPELITRIDLQDLQKYIYNQCKPLKIRRPAGMLEKKINLKSAWSSNSTYKSLKEMKSIAESRGGKCISDIYLTARLDLEWECAEGHRWKAAPYAVKSGTWCLECSGYKTLTNKKMQAIAKERGGKCLSKKYVNAHTRLKWECAHGHRWMDSLGNIKYRSRWCPVCTANKKQIDKSRMRIKELNAIAKSRGGKCLSNNFIGQLTNLEWECKKGHRWEAVPSSIDRGSWCLICANTGKRLTIEQIQDVAKSFGGKCLSKKYVNQTKKLKWKCRSGHVFMKSLKQVKYSRRWCPDCAGSKKLTIEEMQKIARSRGGKCISKKYINTHTKLKWECRKGHQWSTKPSHIKGGSWCPKCRGK